VAYHPIENYAVIGDMHTAALVGMDGSIDWCCLPRFDSPSVFAAILDARQGGYFKLASIDATRNRQMYLPDTNVLITRFLSPAGVGEVVDFMPVEDGAKTHQIVRVAKAIRGHVRFRLECVPAFDFARRPHQVSLEARGAVFEAGDMRVSLISRFPLARIDGGVAVEFTLSPGESTTFILRQVETSRRAELLEARLVGEELLRQTVAYWNRWLGASRYTGRWREMVHRSALALKLLTYQPTGAIVAAPTTALPEEIGGVRNWDYRYTWIRDAALTLHAFMRLGFTEEAAAFMDWLELRAQEGSSHGPLQVMYRVDGVHELPEETLDHLEGYRGSRPVRIGNGACNQLQLDIYGALIDSIYLYDKHGAPIAYDLWVHLRRMLDWVAGNWSRADEGIWEVRGGQQQFVFSKVQCWVALDRGLRLAARRSLPVDHATLVRARDDIYETVMQNGYDASRRTFVQHFGTDALDASNLLMPLVSFVSPGDRRMLGTLRRTMRELVADSLVYRYEIGRGAGDGLTGREGTFNICTFWLVEALARAGEVGEARFIFEKMLTYANHVGLFAEETGPTGEALGNFPQGLTHLGLISAAFALDRALDRRAGERAAP
jgi:GH15 family glucan-1,4-alpha-glucosidase